MKIFFESENTDSRLQESTEEYRRVWGSSGKEILDTLEKVSGLSFQSEAPIQAIVYEGPSHSGKGDEPMRLRASLDFDIKKAALLHELAHRLLTMNEVKIPGAGPGSDNPSEALHKYMFLFLYDAYKLFGGVDFAEKIIEFEQGLGNKYKRAWMWVVNFNEEERKEKWDAVVDAEYNDHLQ